MTGGGDGWMRQHTARTNCELPVYGRERLLWRGAARGGADAVQVAAVPGGVALRHGGWPDGPALVFPVPEWVAFLAAVRTGTFDDLTGSGEVR